MLWVSELLMKHHHIESFDELVLLVKEEARRGELFLRMDIRPPFPNTPQNWEEQLEAAFTAVLEERS